MLLLIILYNLRLTCPNSSRIDIVLGEHELKTLFSKEILDEKNFTFGKKNIHASALNLFGTYELRSKMLLPFYLLEPVVFTLVTENETKQKKPEKEESNSVFVISRIFC